MTRRLILLLALAVPLAAQTPATQPPPTHPTSTPYTGDLSVFEEANRDQKLQIDRVMDTLKLHPGSTVADIGAGGGWFSVRAARRVSPRRHRLRRGHQSSRRRRHPRPRRQGKPPQHRRRPRYPRRPQTPRQLPRRRPHAPRLPRGRAPAHAPRQPPRRP